MASMNVLDENVDVNFSGIHPKLNTNNLKYKAERKSLQVLQQTPDNRLTRNADLQSAKHVKGTTKPFPIFKDPAKCSTPKAAAKKGSTPKSVANKECKHNSSQTESFNCCHCSCHEDEDEVIEEEEEDNKEDLSAEEEAYRLMGQEEVPEDYWKEVADTRSAALEVSMHENELLNSEVAALRKENRRLSELAENAEYFAKILKDLTEDNKSESEQDSDKGHDDDCHSNSDSENNTNERINKEQTNKATINKSDNDDNGTSYTVPKGRAYPICCSDERQDLDSNANTEDHSSP